MVYRIIGSLDGSGSAIADSDYFGLVVKGVGDFDGDGFEDFLVSEPDSNKTSSDQHVVGKVYLVPGKALAAMDLADGVFDRVIDSAHIITNGGYAFGVGSKGSLNTDYSTATSSGLGYSIDALGDIDGDGLVDFALSQNYAYTSAINDTGAFEPSGTVFIVSAADLATLDTASGGTPNFIDVSDIGGNTNSYQIVGAAGGMDRIAAVDDIDGDRISEILLMDDQNGPVLVMSGFFEKADLADGIDDNLVDLDKILGLGGSYQFYSTKGLGYKTHLASLGDFDGDGVGDFSVDYDDGLISYYLNVSGADLLSADLLDGLTDGRIDRDILTAMIDAGTGGFQSVHGPGRFYQSIGDLDGDGKDEIRSNDTYDIQITYSATGKNYALASGASGLKYTPEFGTYEGDLDGDGIRELVFHGPGRGLYVLNSTDMEALDAYGGNSDDDVLYMIDMARMAQEIEEGTYSFSGATGSSYMILPWGVPGTGWPDVFMGDAGAIDMIVDRDGDGRPELLIGSLSDTDLTQTQAPGTTYIIYSKRFELLDEADGSDDNIINLNRVNIGNLNCFAQGTLIETSKGSMPIEALSVGDLVKTLDQGCQPVKWIASSRLSRTRLARHPKLRPIQIAKDALAPGVPNQTLRVSPQHRIFLYSNILKSAYFERGALLSALHLAGVDGVSIDMECGDVTYYHMMFENHALVLANGLWAESFYPGDQALSALEPLAREEMRLIFPRLFEDPASLPPVRPFLKKDKAITRILARHIKNNQPFQEMNSLVS